MATKKDPATTAAAQNGIAEENKQQQKTLTVRDDLVLRIDDGQQRIIRVQF